MIDGCVVVRACVSHAGRRRCSIDMDAIATGCSAPAVALPAVLSADGHAAAERAERTDELAVAIPPGRGAVRADLEQVFRTAYPRVVAVAARVLGSRDAAEDVAQEVFVAFGRSSVPAGEALGWLSVAAAHTALNHVRSGRRRISREAATRDSDPLSPDI